MRSFLIILLALCVIATPVLSQLVVRPAVVPRVTAKPGASFTATLKAYISGYSGTRSGIFARYLGDADLPADGDGNPEGLRPLGSNLACTGWTDTPAGRLYTFTANFKAYAYEAGFQPNWVIATSSQNVATNWGAVMTGFFDITCSDGVYCNGVERYVRNKCVASPVLPCQIKNKDGSINLCSSYACNETLKRCNPYPLGGLIADGGRCNSCAAVPCTPSCGTSQQPAVCGDDGCGGSCGTCPNNLFCVAGACQSVTAFGSCANPQPLFGDSAVVPAEGVTYGSFRTTGDSSLGLDMAQPICQSPGIKEWVFKFTIPESVGPDGMGVIIQVTGDDGTFLGDNGADTVLAIHDGSCQPYQGTAVDRLCSDDQTPPGNLASRVDGKLPPGDYTLIVTGYSPSTLGPFVIFAKFTPGCYPKCDAKFCGSDDCGGFCGLLDGTEGCGGTDVCNAGRCGPPADQCVPQCQARQCGPDGCGGECGVCKNKKICDLGEGVCVPITQCNSMFPNCPNNRQGNGPQDAFCGSDCEWHRTSEPMADLVPNTGPEVIPSVSFKWAAFDQGSCALNEGCVGGAGQRLLMSFDTRVHNVGTAGYVGLALDRNPDLFTWASCHQHYHFQKFARFSLWSFDGNSLVLPGAKLSYCMEDGTQYLLGNDIACDQQFDCTNQGIPRGRTDTYAGSLDCQWLDLTDLYHAGKLNQWFQYEVCTNIGRTLFEMAYDNNCVRFPLYIPQVPNDGRTHLLDEYTPRSFPAESPASLIFLSMIATLLSVFFYFF